MVCNLNRWLPSPSSQTSLPGESIPAEPNRTELKPMLSRSALGWWRTTGRLVNIFAASRVVRACGLLQGYVVLVVTVVPFVRVEGLAGGLLVLGGRGVGTGAGGVLRRRGLVVLIATVAEPAASVAGVGVVVGVLRLLLLAVVVPAAGGHPAGAVAGVQAAAAAAAVGDAAPADEQDDEEDDDDGGEDPASPVVPT